jgi:hypothetical protein
VTFLPSKWSVSPPPYISHSATFLLFLLSFYFGLQSVQSSYKDVMACCMFEHEGQQVFNQRDALISEIYFWNRTLRVSDSFSVHHQESSTVHTVIGICHTGYADCLLAGSGCSILIPLASRKRRMKAHLQLWSKINIYLTFVRRCTLCGAVYLYILCYSVERLRTWVNVSFLNNNNNNNNNCYYCYCCCCRCCCIYNMVKAISAHGSVITIVTA